MEKTKYIIVHEKKLILSLNIMEKFLLKILSDMAELCPCATFTFIKETFIEHLL